MKYSRTLSTTDFYEMMAGYQEYAEKHNGIRLYSQGLVLTSLGLSQGASSTTFMGVSYIGQGILQQLNIIANPYQDELVRYQNASAKFKSKEEAESWTREALRQLLEQERQAQQLDGAIMAGNGLLVVTSDKPNASWIGVLMIAMGGYLGLFEKGPLAKTIDDHGFLKSEAIIAK